MSALVLTRVDPLSTRLSLAFVDYADGRGGVEPVTARTYPPPAFNLRALRRELDLSMGDAAHILGIRVTQVSDLEHGALSTDWTEVERRLRGRQ